MPNRQGASICAHLDALRKADHAKHNHDRVGPMIWGHHLLAAADDAKNLVDASPDRRSVAPTHGCGACRCS